MALWMILKGFVGQSCNHLPSVDLMVNELFTEEVLLKSHSHSEKGNLSTPLIVFPAPINKGKSQGMVGIGNDECAFCKKGHWIAQCPKLLRSNWRSFKTPSNIDVVVPPSIAPGILLRD